MPGHLVRAGKLTASVLLLINSSCSISSRLRFSSILNLPFCTPFCIQFYLLARSSSPGGGLTNIQPPSRFTSGTIASTKGTISVRPSGVLSSSSSFLPLIRLITFPMVSPSALSRASNPTRSSRWNSPSSSSGRSSAGTIRVWPIMASAASRLSSPAKRTTNTLLPGSCRPLFSSIFRGVLPCACNQRVPGSVNRSGNSLAGLIRTSPSARHGYYFAHR